MSEGGSLWQALDFCVSDFIVRARTLDSERADVEFWPLTVLIDSILKVDINYAYFIDQDMEVPGSSSPASGQTLRERNGGNMMADACMTPKECPFIVMLEHNRQAVTHMPFEAAALLEIEVRVPPVHGIF